MLRLLEKRVSIAAIIFVLIYLGAAGLTLYYRSSDQPTEKARRLETAEIKKSESRLAIVQLFPPMMVLLTLAVVFVIVKQKRERQLAAMEASDNEDVPDSHQLEKGEDQKA
jgi:hypothetical protein